MSVRDKQRLSAVSTARWSSGKLVAIEVAMFAIVLCPGGVSTGAREPCTGASAKAPLLHRSAWRNISRMVSNRPSEMLETPPIYMSSSSPVVIPVRTTRTRTSRSLLSHVADNCVCTTHTHTTAHVNQGISFLNQELHLLFVVCQFFACLLHREVAAMRQCGK